MNPPARRAEPWETHRKKVPGAPETRDRETLLSASITLATADEIKQLFLDYRAAGVPFAQSLRNEPWQAKTFIVKDPEGNLILFAGPAN